MVDDVVDAAEVVHRLNNIIHIHRLVSNADSVRLEDIACLVVCQTAAFDVIGVIGQVNLRAMIDATLQSRVFLLSQSSQQGRHLLLGGSTLGQNSIRRDVPRLSCEENSINLSARTIIAGRAFRNAELLGKLHH